MSHNPIMHQVVSTSFKGVYFAEGVYVKKTVQGKEYTDMMLRDASGSRNVKYWGIVGKLESGMWVDVDVRVEEYMGLPSLIAASVKTVAEPSDLKPYISEFADKASLAESFDKARVQLAESEKKIGSTILMRIVDDVFNNSGFFDKFISVPASEKSFYGKIGGLMGNVARLADACVFEAGRNNLTDRERCIAIASALLCRIGAADAYSFNGCIPTISEQGVLLGIGSLTMARLQSVVKRVAAASPLTPVDAETVLRLLHAIVSHENGIKPMTREAIILKSVFESDVLIASATDFISTDENKEKFTAYDPALGRKYFVGTRQ